MTVTAPLYARIMGSSWNDLGEPLQCLHGSASTVRADGHLCIDRGRHRLARLLGRLLRLPQPSASADVRLIIASGRDDEHWVRTFDGRRLDTWQYQWHDGLAERFGVLEFRFRLRASGGSLSYAHAGVFLCWPVRVRIPERWAPCVEAREDPAGPTRIQVDVRVGLPRVGLLISYAGIVELTDTRS